MQKQQEMCETGGGTLEIDEDTGKPHWVLWGADWKDEDRMDEGECMQLAPHAFPPGTRVIILEPNSPETDKFYADLLEQQANRGKVS